jgi:hypothetical protein
MKLSLTILFTITAIQITHAQKIDSICFHLYTDSLKKGTHNYINVDGKLSTGKWKPLTAKEILFTTDYGIFKGNELVLPSECNVEKVTVKAVLKSEPWKRMDTTIWIKIKPDDEKLPTIDEIMKPGKSEKKKSKNNSPV